MQISLSELAQLTGGRIIKGKLDSFYTGMASLDLAESSDVSFLGNAKYRQQFFDSKAGVILVTAEDQTLETEAAMIVVENPTLAFSAVVSYFIKETSSYVAGVNPSAIIGKNVKLNPEKCCIHPGVVIMDGVEIGDGTEIYPNATICKNVKIGKDCIIYANVSVRENCSIGDRVILQSGVVIGSDGFGYEFVNGKHSKIPQVGTVEIHDDVEVGANSSIDRARFGKTIIGEGSKIDNLVQIGHNVEVGKHCIIVAQTGIAGSVKLGDYVVIAAQVGIAGHVNVAAGSVLGARTGVTKSLTEKNQYLGNPAFPMKEAIKIRALTRKLPQIYDDLQKIKKQSL